jgi:hypothetical protein
VFHRAKRVAAHQRRYGGRRHGTDPDHMPSAHRRYAAWSPARFQRWAHSIGPNTEALVIAVLGNFFRDLVSLNRADAFAAIVTPCAQPNGSSMRRSHLPVPRCS